jgi:isopentenyl diphosphate isomerase/L-lactate dehydrogenase-like FMN-dependent dehydrogenase
MTYQEIIEKALAANGSEGVRDLIIAMTEELQRVMTLTGCQRISEIDASILVRR